MDEMNTDGNDNVQIKAEGNAVSAIGDGAMAAGRDITVNTGIPFEEFYKLQKSLDNKSDEINQKDERISRLEEQLLEVKSKLTDSEEKLKEAVHAAEETAKSIEEDGYTIDPQQEIILGSASWILGEYQQAEVYFKRAMLEFEKEDDQYMIGYTSNNIARIFQSLGLFSDALKWFEKALKIAKSFDITMSILNTMHNISTCYQMMGNDEQYLRILNDSIKLIKPLNEDDFPLPIAVIYSEMANYYNIKGNKSKCKLYTRKALQLLDENNEEHTDVWMTVYTYKIFEAMDRKDLKEVMRLSEKSIKHYESTQDYRSLSTEFSNLSRFVLEISDDYELAHTLAISALNYAEGVGEIDRIITCKMTLCTVYFARGQIDDFKNLFSQINDELQGFGINPKLRWESQQFPFEILNSI